MRFRPENDIGKSLRSHIPQRNSSCLQRRRARDACPEIPVIQWPSNREPARRRCPHPTHRECASGRTRLLHACNILAHCIRQRSIGKKIFPCRRPAFLTWPAATATWLSHEEFVSPKSFLVKENSGL